MCSNKLEKRSKKGILICYASSTKGYRVWFPETKEVQETKHLKMISEPVRDLSARMVWFKVHEDLVEQTSFFRLEDN